MNILQDDFDQCIIYLIVFFIDHTFLRWKNEDKTQMLCTSHDLKPWWKKTKEEGEWEKSKTK